MEIAKGKTRAFAIAMLLLLSMGASIMLLPNANAQSIRYTYAYIGALPNPATVGQQVLLHVGITQQLSIVGMGWEGCGQKQ